MRVTPRFRFPFKRRSEGRTDYKRRLRLLDSRKPRLVVRRSLNYVQAQLVQFGEKGDVTLASANSRSLKRLGWSFACDNTPSAYLAGLAAGKAALKNGVEEAVLDIGLYRSTKGNRVYAAAKGAVDAGLKLNVDEGMFPSDERLSGKHVSKHFESARGMPEKFEEIKRSIAGE